MSLKNRLVWWLLRNSEYDADIMEQIRRRNVATSERLYNDIVELRGDTREEIQALKERINDLSVALTNLVNKKHAHLEEQIQHLDSMLQMLASEAGLEFVQVDAEPEHLELREIEFKGGE